MRQRRQRKLDGEERGVEGESVPFIQRRNANEALTSYQLESQ